MKNYFELIKYIQQFLLCFINKCVPPASALSAQHESRARGLYSRTNAEWPTKHIYTRLHGLACAIVLGKIYNLHGWLVFLSVVSLKGNDTTTTCRTCECAVWRKKFRHRSIRKPSQLVVVHQTPARSDLYPINMRIFCCCFNVQWHSTSKWYRHTP